MVFGIVIAILVLVFGAGYGGYKYGAKSEAQLNTVEAKLAAAKKLL